MFASIFLYKYMVHLQLLGLSHDKTSFQFLNQLIKDYHLFLLLPSGDFIAQMFYRYAVASGHFNRPVPRNMLKCKRIEDWESTAKQAGSNDKGQD